MILLLALHVSLLDAILLCRVYDYNCTIIHLPFIGI